MADKYFNSAGSNTSPYESEATGATNLETLAETIGIWSGDDKILCQYDDANYSYSVNTILNPASTSNSYLRNFVSVSDLTTPDTEQYGFLLGTMSGYNMSLCGRCNFYGFHFYAGYSGTPATSSNFVLGSSAVGINILNFYDCTFESGYTGGSTIYIIVFGVSSTQVSLEISLFDCTIRTNDNYNYAGYLYGGNITLNNLTMECSGDAAPIYLFIISGYFFGIFTLENSDLSGVAPNYLFNAGSARSGKFFVKNCKLNASTEVAYQLGNTYIGTEIYIMDCDKGSTHIYYQRRDSYGLMSFDTGVYATTSPMVTKDGNPCSIRLDSNANVGASSPICTEWISKWVDAEETTLNVEVLVGGDGADALTDKQLWLEVCYMDNATDHLGSFPTTQQTDLFTAASNVSAGTIAWTGDGYTTERTHKLSLTFTPGQAGNIRYRVCFAKASATVFINPA